MAADIRASLILPPKLAREIDDYWHEQRLASRSEAIRALLEVGLNAARLDEDELETLPSVRRFR